jgi:hypothetical protein
MRVPRDRDQARHADRFTDAFFKHLAGLGEISPWIVRHQLLQAHDPRDVESDCLREIELIALEAPLLGAIA